MENLIKVVRKLREAQKKYFKTRDYQDLKRAKQLETQVDIMLDAIEHSPQQKLF